MKLVVIAGKKKGTEIPLKPGETTIGRTADNTIRLSSSTVSRKHAVLVVGNGGCELRDLESTSGTYVNGNRVSDSVQLPEGATIQIGEYAFRLVSAGNGAAPGTGTQGTQAGNRPTGATGVRTGSRSAAVVPVTDARTGPGERRTGPSARSKFGSAVPSEAAAAAASQASGRFFGLEWRYQVFAALGVVGLAAVAGLTFFFFQARAEFHDYAVQRAILLTHNMALKNGEYLKRKQHLQLNVDDIRAEPGVKSAWLLDADLRILVPKAQKGRKLKDPAVLRLVSKVVGALESDLPANERLFRQPGGFYYIAEPITVWDSEDLEFVTYGVALLEFSPQEVAASLANTAVRVGIAVILLVVAGMGAYVLLRRVTVNPIIRLQEDTELMVQGLQPKVVSFGSMPELAELAASINRAANRGPSPQTQTHTEPDPVSAAYGPRPATLKALPGGASTAPVAESALVALVGVQPEPTLIVDDSSNVMLLNDPAAELLGTRRESAKGKHILEVVQDPGLQSALLEAISQLSTSDANLVTQEVDVGGSTRNLSASAVRAGNQLAAAAVIIR